MTPESPKPPERIYLQGWGGAEPTWCADRIDEGDEPDVEYVRADAARSIIAGEIEAEGVRHRAAAEQHKHSRDALSDSSRRASLAHAFRYEGVARWLRSQKGDEDPIRTPSLGQPAPATNHTEALGPSTTPEEGGGR